MSVEQDDYDRNENEEPRTPGGSIGRPQPLRKPSSQKVQYSEQDHRMAGEVTSVLQASEVHGGHDALKVLFEAAAMRERAGSGSGARPSGLSSGMTPTSIQSITSPELGRQGSFAPPAQMTAFSAGTPQFQTQPQQHRIDPAITQDGARDTAPINSTEYAAAVKAWTRYRFVRAGWFTAREGISYIQYFYKYLSPLTPITLPDFQSIASHRHLLEQEPMLVVTMLLVASRHMVLEGPGSASRPYAIHHKLWTYLQGMINRIVWGQEQFGGGFCGAGSEPSCDVNPLSRKGLRTLGTVESLMMLTEWHPRAMHFPPDEADEELMIPDEPFATPDPADPELGNKGIGGHRMDSWLEPCWRSDRMCWMLLGMAMSLAFEIGVFDKNEWQRHAQSADGVLMSGEDLQAYDRRRGNVRDLLLVYVTQTSGRLGLTSMLPGNYSEPQASDVFRKPISTHINSKETVIHFWLRLADLMKDGNNCLFRNKKFTRNLIKGGGYRAQLERMQPALASWRNDFDRVTTISENMRHVLNIEYEYSRTYLNSLALQALVERCANDNPVASTEIHPPLEMARSAISTNGLRADNAIDSTTLAKWLGGDRYFISQTRDAARNLLKAVVEGLGSGDYLKHAPVRTYFRIISGAIILLKSFALGASEDYVTEAFGLMDRTVEALRNCIVDDVHVASRFADLLDTLTQSMKPRFVRMAGDGRQAHSRRPSNFGLQGENAQANQNNNIRWPGTPNQNGHSNLNQLSTQQQQQHQAWNYTNGTFTPNNNQNTNNSSTPLHYAPPNSSSYDYPSLPADLQNPNMFSVMPPPSFAQSPTSTFNATHNQNNNQNNSNNTALPNTPGSFDAFASSGFGDAEMQDWLTLPLDPLINISPGVDVNQTMYGPELGGQDMLELLLGGGQFGSGGQGGMG